MKRRFELFRRLSWKLTLSYTLVTVTAVLVLEAAGLFLLLSFAGRSTALNAVAERVAVEVAVMARPLMSSGTYSPPDVGAWLQAAYPPSPPGSNILRVNYSSQNDGGQIQFYPGEKDLVAVIGPAGEFVAANLPESQLASAAGAPFQDLLVEPESQDLIALALAGDQASLSLPNRAILAVAPIRAEDNTLLGVVYLRFVSLTPELSGAFFLATLQLLGASVLVFTLGAGAIGTLFGFFTARGLSRRLSTVSTAADSWSRGDFSAFVYDKSGDELGQLARRLNRMAEQLQNLIQARQGLAALEERNRLARDLHDSVKQQVFATAMQVGAARALLDRDPQSAREHLIEAEQLARQAQAELTGLIRELRPATLQDHGLVQALQEYTAGWSRQNDIPVDTSLQGERVLPLEVEQALFRVAQEALSNIARHSAAGRVHIHLSWHPAEVVLTIADDGRGFDPAAVDNLGIGLRSMHERLADLGGRLSVESAPGKGTRLIAAVPTSNDTSPGRPAAVSDLPLK